MASETNETQLAETEDTLLESYLEHLNTYTTLRSTLTTSLSRSYLSLSKANFHASAGRRYGSDWFDERLRAAARIEVTPKGRLQAVRKDYSKVERKRREVNDVEHLNSYQGKEQKKQVLPLPASGETSTQLEKDLSQLQLGDAEREKTSDEQEETILNPLYQFGILVPQALRQAQNEFSEAVVIMVQLVNIDCEMRELENKIQCYRNKDEQNQGNKSTSVEDQP